MNKLKELEIKRLLSELEYIESDFEYRNEIISEADIDFLESVNDFLIENPELKKLYDEKIREAFDTIITEKDLSLLEDSYIEEENILFETKDEDKKSSKIKKAYREIVKITHPDKGFNDSIDTYIRATKFYDDNDIVGMIRLCSELKIDIEIEEEEDLLIKNRIAYIKQKVDFIESTMTWQWLESKDEDEKKRIILFFIENRLS